MKNLWAPWRAAYLKSFHTTKPAKKKGCFICDYLRSRNDIENLVIARGRLALSLMNRYPYNNGHVMVAPKAHKGSLMELTDAELAEIFQMTRDTVAVLTKAFKPQGFNIGVNMGDVAGTSLPSHLHVHIVPRWQGDTNFMPVTGGVKVISETLEETLLTIRKNLPLQKYGKNSDICRGGRRKS